jgi:trk system potassium uptake protein TrkH
MNLRFVVNQLGLLGMILSGVLMLVGLAALAAAMNGIDAERPAARAFLLAAGSGAVIAFAARLLSRSKTRHFERREALLLVAASWVLGAALAGLPFLLWAHVGGLHTPAAAALRNPVNCYFEGMSGLTTTGATVLVGLDDMPRTILVWRGLTQWIGGLGIVVLFVAVFPTLGSGSKRLFLTEAGASREGITPQFRETAKLLWFIYLGLTAAEIVVLRLAGMGWIDAVAHTFTTLATGGFSTRDASVGGFESPGIQWIILLFMVLGGVNFGLYCDVLRGRLRALWRNPELRLYLAMLAVATLILWVLVVPAPLTSSAGEEIAPGAWGTLRFAAFNLVSVHTTTGFATADFDRWPELARFVLVLAMFVGGCAGSTSGGIKVFRVWITFRVLIAEIEHAVRPHVVRPLRVGGTVLSERDKLTTLAHVLGFLAVFVVGSIGLLVLEQRSGADLATALSAVSACLFTIGPGLARVGPVENYLWLGDTSKLWLTWVMLLGRLEVLAIIALLSPRFWRRGF